MSKKGLSGDEALELSDLLEKIGRIDLGKLAEERVDPMDRLVKEMEKDGGLSRKKVRTSPKIKKQHWATRRKKRRQYHREKVVPRKKARLAQQLKTPEGWYPYITRKWKERDLGFFTLDQWVGIIWPCLGGRVPVFGRYDRRKGFTLENTVVRDDRTGDVLFDGIEYRMYNLGYIRRYSGQST